MRALVTGAGGQLGRTVARVLADGCDVVPLTRAELDVTDESRVRSAVAEARPGVIVNCAAYNAVDEAEDDAVAALEVNAFGVRSLARAAAEIDATLVHYGTDFVFDGSASEPYREEDEPNPQSVYAASKLLGEWFARGARHYVLRVESLFGGGMNGPGADGRRPGGSLDRIAGALRRGARGSGRSSTGSCRRATSRTSPRPRSRCCWAAPAPGLYHCVGSGHATWLEVARELAERLGVEPVIRGITLDELHLRAARPRFCALSNRKLAAAGIEMPHWRDAVARYAGIRRRGS